jgi:hypothetical protein
LGSAGSNFELREVSWKRSEGFAEEKLTDSLTDFPNNCGASRIGSGQAID